MGLDGQRQQLSTYLFYITCAIALLTAVYVRLRVIQVPLERDEGEFAYSALLLLKGINPFTDVYTMKLPGVAACYALFMTLFGMSSSAIHLGLLTVSALNAWLVFLLAHKLFDRNAALFACAAYALLSLSQSVLGVFAHATHFVVLFCLAGFNLMLAQPDRQTRPATMFASGLCFGIAFIMKQHALPLLAFALIQLVRIRQRRAPATNISPVLPYTSFLAGTATPLFLIGLTILHSGAYEQFLRWNIVNAKEYVSSLTVAEGMRMFAAEFPPLLATQPFFWGLASAGLLLLLFGNRPACSDRFFVLGLLVFSFLAVLPGFYFRKHYFILLLPPISLLAGAAAAKASAIVGKSTGPIRVIVPLALIAIVCHPLYLERDYLFRLSPLQISRSLFGANPFPEAAEIGRYIRERSSAEDRIAVLGSEPEIYFYADRLSATGYLYMYGLMENTAAAVGMQRDLIAEIEGARPKFIVVVTVHASWLPRFDTPPILPEWQGKYLREQYHCEGVVDIISPEFTRYLWNRETCRDYIPVSSEFITIYRRLDRKGDGA